MEQNKTNTSKGGKERGSDGRFKFRPGRPSRERVGQRVVQTSLSERYLLVAMRRLNALGMDTPTLSGALRAWLRATVEAMCRRELEDVNELSLEQVRQEILERLQGGYDEYKEVVDKMRNELRGEPSSPSEQPDSGSLDGVRDRIMDAVKRGDIPVVE